MSDTIKSSGYLVDKNGIRMEIVDIVARNSAAENKSIPVYELKIIADSDELGEWTYSCDPVDFYDALKSDIVNGAAHMIRGRVNFPEMQLLMLAIVHIYNELSGQIGVAFMSYGLEETMQCIVDPDGSVTVTVG